MGKVFVINSSSAKFTILGIFLQREIERKNYSQKLLSANTVAVFNFHSNELRIV